MSTGKYYYYIIMSITPQSFTRELYLVYESFFRPIFIIIIYNSLYDNILDSIIIFKHEREIFFSLSIFKDTADVQKNIVIHTNLNHNTSIINRKLQSVGTF